MQEEMDTKVKSLVHEKIAFLKYQEEKEKRKNSIKIGLIAIFLIGLFSYSMYYNSLLKTNTINRFVSSGSNYNTNSVAEYPTYYGGMYQNGEQFIVLLTENTKENQEAILTFLGLTRTNTVFQEARFSYSELTLMQQTIFNHQYPFVKNVVILESENRVGVIVDSLEKEKINLILQLDENRGMIKIKKEELYENK